MVGADGVADLGLLLELLGEFHADDCVRQFRFVVGHLADVVQQACPAGDLGVETQLRGHDACEVRRFTGMLQQVLSVGRTVFHLADHADQFGVQSVDSQVDRRALADLDDLLLDLLLNLGDHLLDACGVDAAVGDELVQGQTRDFAAYGIEAREDDGLGGVVDDDLDARRGLQSADVAALAADDAALDLVALDVEHRHGVFDGRLGRHALNRRHDDALGLFRGGQFGLFDRFVDVGGGFGLGLGLHVFDQDVLGVFGTHARDLLQACVLFALHLVDLLLLVFEDLQLVLHLLFQTVVLAEFVFQFALLVLQVLLDLLGALLALGDFLVALVDLTVVFALELYELFLCLKDALLLDHLSLGFSLLDGGFAALADRRLDHEVRYDRVDCDGDHGRD